MSEPPHCETLLLQSTTGRLYITFNRPQRRNAMNDQMIAELAGVVNWLATHKLIRVVIFRGADRNFCAGGDIKERRERTEQISKTQDPVYERNLFAGHLFRKIANLPQTTVALVEGAAMGGGFGLACVVDITLVDVESKMGMPETTLGIAPAQIAPHVVRRIGLTRARHMALTGRRIGGEEAFQLGIAQYCFRGPEEGERQLETLLQEIERCGPLANAITKEIMSSVGRLSEEATIEFAAERFARLNKSEEGKEGQRAFVEKRQPKWPVVDS